MQNEHSNTREERALDALLAAALRHPEDAKPSGKEVREFLKRNKSLSPEAKAAIRRLGPNVVNRLILSQKRSKVIESTQEESMPLFAAMNRQNASNQHDPKTEEELKRKRKEILERLKRKQSKDKK
jgi:hypothetical protein